MNSRNLQTITVIKLLCFVVTSCSIYSIRYDRHDLLYKYGATHQFYLNDNEVDLDTLILDSRNIKSVIRDREKSSIYIVEKEVRQLNSFQKYAFGYDSNSSNSDTLIVIDGIPLYNDAKYLHIDSLAIKNIRLLKKSDLNAFSLCLTPQNIILITTF